jgi:hypothetical protein
VAEAEAEMEAEAEAVMEAEAEAVMEAEAEAVNEAEVEAVNCDPWCHSSDRVSCVPRTGWKPAVVT